MFTKGKVTTIIILVLIVIVGGFLWYRSYSAKKNAENIQATGDISSFENAVDENGNNIAIPEGDNLDEEMQDFNAQCEAGEWLKIADQSGEQATMSGKLRRVYPDDETSKDFSGYSYFLEGTAKIALTGSNLAKLDYFEDRDTEVQGVKSANGKELAVSQVRCAGAETDKNKLDQRRKLMSYIAANINTIAPKKAKYQKWTVDIVEFVDDSNIYVEYYDAIEDDENSEIEDDTAHRILLETAATSGGFGAKVLAYWEMGEDDYVLKEGSDKFENVTDTNTYQYDPELKVWDRID